MKFRRALLATTLSAVMICGCTTDKPAGRGPIGDIEEATPTPKPTEAPAEAPTPTEAPADPEIDLYGIMSDWKFDFSSGAGGWGTSLTVNPDGSFEGYYSDSEMGSTGPGYSKGTVYKCAFSGRFTDFERVDDYIYNVTIGSIKYENQPGDQEVLNDVLYIYTEPYGIGSQTELTVYLPGCPFKNLADGFVSWMDYQRFGAYAAEEYYRDYPEYLYFCGIYNEGDDCGFSSANRSGDNQCYMINTQHLPGLINQQAQIERDNTYFYVDASNDGTISIKNCSFRATLDSDIYWSEDEFVDLCLNRIGANPEDGSLQVFGKDFNKDGNYARYTYINGNSSLLAFWIEGSNEDTRYNLAVFSQMTGTWDGQTDSIDPGYAYAYVINYHPDYCPYSTLALQSYLSTLDFAGTPDRLSSASYDDLDAEASSCALVTGSSDFDHLEADLVEIVYETDDSKIQEYGLSAKDFENYGWTIVGIDQDYTRYTISDDCPIYVTFTDNLFDTCLTKDEFADRMSKDPDGGLMYLYFNTDGEVVFIQEAVF